MKISFMKRLEEAEKRAAAIVPASPGLILISFDADTDLWIIKEQYAGSRRAETALKRLQDYCFHAEWVSSVIIDSFGNSDPAFGENLFAFDLPKMHRRFGKIDLFIHQIRQLDGNEAELILSDDH